MKNLLSPNVKKIYLFSDNCSGQNKNNALFQYLYTVLKSKLYGIEQIIYMYPEPGHSFLPNDRCFGRIEKKRKRLEQVYLPETYHELVHNTSKKFEVIKVTQDIIFNFSDSLSSMFKKNGNWC